MPGNTPGPLQSPYVRDPRSDIVSQAALVSVSVALDGAPPLSPHTTAVVVVTRHGCGRSLVKVRTAAARNHPQQGVFVRAGAQSIAAAIAREWKLHGATLTLVGGSEVLPLVARQIAVLANAEMFSDLWLVVADADAEATFAGALLLTLPLADPALVFESEGGLGTQNPAAIFIDWIARKKDGEPLDLLNELRRGAGLIRAVSLRL